MGWILYFSWVQIFEGTSLGLTYQILSSNRYFTLGQSHDKPDLGYFLLTVMLIR